MGDIVLIFAIFGLGGWVVFLFFGTLRRRQQNAMQKHLLDKFSSAHDFAEFVQSPAGQKYVTGISDATGAPQGSILGSVRLGIVLIFVGGAFFAIHPAWPEEIRTTQAIGILLTMLGVGFLVSAAVSHVIAKRIESEPTK